MANDNIKIGLELDMKDTRAKLDDANKALEVYSKKLEDLEEDIKRSGKATESQSKALSDLKATVKECSDAAKGFESTLRTQQGEMRELQDAIQKTNQANIDLAASFGSLGINLGAMPGAMAKVNNAWKDYKNAVNSGSKATEELRKALISTGIGAIVVLVGELVAHWDELTAAFHDGTEEGEEVAKVMEKIQAAVMGVVSAVKTYLVGCIKIAIQAVKSLATAFSGVFEGIKKALDGDFKGAAKTIGDSTKKAVTDYGDTWKKVGSECANSFVKGYEDSLNNNENSKKMKEADEKAAKEAADAYDRAFTAESVWAGISKGKKYGPGSTQEEETDDSVPQMSAEDVAAFEKKYGTGSYARDKTDSVSGMKYSEKLGRSSGGTGYDPEKKKELLEEMKNSTIEGVGEISNAVASGLSSIYQTMLDNISDALDAIDERIEESNDKIADHQNNLVVLSNQLGSATAEEVEHIKASMAQEEAALAKEQAEKKKAQAEEKKLKQQQADIEYKQKKADAANAIVQSIVNTALSITTTSAQLGYPAAIPFVALATAAGDAATITASVNAAKIKKAKFANGGLLSGPSHSQGGIPVPGTNIELEGNEFVVNAEDTARNYDLLCRINHGDPASGGRRQRHLYADGGTLNFNPSNYVNFSPVVSVVDIADAMETRTMVRDLAR